MFGYFRFNQDWATPEMKNVYKNYYCGICFALGKNYGEIPRFLLSYDVVILGLLLKCHKEATCKRLPCFGDAKNKTQFSEEEWKKIAAINILLVSAKIDDDIHDENSMKAKCAELLLKSVIKAARTDYPEISDIIDGGYKMMATQEDNKANILVICKTFSDMMGNLVEKTFGLSGIQLDYIKAISNWLYFIDQLDDYDDDLKEKKFNPCAVKGYSKNQYVNQKHNDINNILKTLMMDFNRVKAGMNITSAEDRILYSIISASIPSVTLRVMLGQELPKFMHTRKKAEWSVPE